MKTENLLTIREQEVLQLIAKAQPRKRIADCLAISVNTVNAHIANMHRKFRTHSMVELTIVAVKSGSIN